MTTANLTVIGNVLFKRGNTTVASAYTGVPGEIIIDTTLHTIRIQDGVTAGGRVLASAQDAANIANSNVSALVSNAGVQALAITSLQANAATQATLINAINANVTAANATITSLQSNAAIQATLLDTLTGNAVTQSQVLDTLTSNAAAQASSLTTLLSNAVAQQTSLIDLVANAATQAQAIANVTGTYGNANVATYLSAFDGNILPSANVTYSLGSETRQWRDLWVSNNTIYIGNTPIRVAGGTLLVNGAPVSGGYSNANVATYLPTYTGNIAGNIVKSGYTWTFGSNGTLTLPAQAATLTNVNQIVSAKIYRAGASTDTVTIQTALDNWMGAEQVWIDVRDQDAQMNAGQSARPWAGLPSYTAYPVILNYQPTGSQLPVPGNMSPTAKTASDAYLIYKELQRNIDIVAGANTFSFENTGALRVPGVITKNNNLQLVSAGTTVYQGLSDQGLPVEVLNDLTAAVVADGEYGRVFIRTDDGTTLRSWQFDVNGNLTLPSGGIITEGGGISGAIRLTPAGGANANQALLIYPTAAGDGDHVHLTTGGGSTELYLGNDFHYVKLVDGGNIELRAATANLSSQAAWTFDTTGNIDTIQALGIKVPNGVPTNVAVINSTTGSWEMNPTLSLATTGGSGSGLTVNVAETGGYASTIEIATAGTGYTNGDLITVTSGTSNATFTIVIAGRNTWQFGGTGNLTIPGNINFANGVNILSTVGAGAYGNTQVAAYLPTYTGNITAGNIIANVTPAITSTPVTGVGYIGMPQRASATGTLTIADAGRHVYVTTTGQTITIPANSNVAYPIGTTIAFIGGPSATTTTIAITTDTMYLAGTGTTGSRTLAAYGMATAVKVASTTWYINGSGLT